MLGNRNDALPRRLMATVLVMLNVVAIREEYIDKAGLGWVSILCFMIGLFIVAWYMRTRKT